MVRVYVYGVCVACGVCLWCVHVYVRVRVGEGIRSSRHDLNSLKCMCMVYVYDVCVCGAYVCGVYVGVGTRFPRHDSSSPCMCMHACVCMCVSVCMLTHQLQ